MLPSWPARYALHADPVQRRGGLDRKVRTHRRCPLRLSARLVRRLAVKMCPVCPVEGQGTDEPAGPGQGALRTHWLFQPGMVRPVHPVPLVPIKTEGRMLAFDIGVAHGPAAILAEITRIRLTTGPTSGRAAKVMAATDQMPATRKAPIAGHLRHRVRRPCACPIPVDMAHPWRRRRPEGYSAASGVSLRRYPRLACSSARV